MSAAVYWRSVHAAHCGDGAGWDLEQWTYAQPTRLPRPGEVPTDAEYHHGFLEGGVQYWVYVRRAPLSEGTCSRCEGDKRLLAPRRAS